MFKLPLSQLSNYHLKINLLIKKKNCLFIMLMQYKNGIHGTSR